MGSSHTMTRRMELILIKLTRFLAFLSGVYPMEWTEKVPGRAIANYLDVPIALMYLSIDIWSLFKGITVRGIGLFSRIGNITLSISSLGVLTNYCLLRKSNMQLHRKFENIANEDEQSLHRSCFILPMFLLVILIKMYNSLENSTQNFNNIVKLPVVFNNFVIILECLTLEKKLRVLNWEIMGLSYHRTQTKIILRIFTKRYKEIVGLVNEMNYCQGCNYLNFSLMSMLRTVIVMYRAITAYKTNYSSHLLSSHIEIALFTTVALRILFVGVFLYMCWCSSLLLEQWETTLELVLNLKLKFYKEMDHETKALIDAFIKQLYYKQVRMSSFSIFSFNLKMFSTFVENAVTYIIVALQFSEVTF